MTFFIDDEKRFSVTPVPPGYELCVDGVRIYCGKTRDVVRYVSEYMIDGVVDTGVVDALARVEAAVMRAGAIVDAVTVAQAVVSAFDTLRRDGRVAAVKRASLLLSACESVNDLKARDDCQTVVAQAKAVVSVLEEFVDGR